RHSANHTPQEQRGWSDATCDPHRGHEYTRRSSRPPEGLDVTPHTGHPPEPEGTVDPHSAHANVGAVDDANRTPHSHCVASWETRRRHDGHWYNSTNPSFPRGRAFCRPLEGPSISRTRWRSSKTCVRFRPRVFDAPRATGPIRELTDRAAP